MFQGQFTKNMDEKGRISIPATFREALKHYYDDERVIITRDAQDTCLRGYPMQEWNKLLQRFSNQPASKREIKAFARVVISAASEHAPDRQGRILVPPTLRDYSKLNKAAMFSGTMKTFELWDKSLWDAETESSLAVLRDADLDF